MFSAFLGAKPASTITNNDRVVDAADFPNEISRHDDSPWDDVPPAGYSHPPTKHLHNLPNMHLNLAALNGDPDKSTDIYGSDQEVPQQFVHVPLSQHMNNQYSLPGPPIGVPMKAAFNNNNTGNIIQSQSHPSHSQNNSARHSDHHVATWDADVEAVNHQSTLPEVPPTIISTVETDKSLAVPAVEDPWGSMSSLPGASMASLPATIQPVSHKNDVSGQSTIEKGF